MQCSDFYDQCTCTEDGRTTAVVNLVACDELDFLYMQWTQTCHFPM